MVLSVLLYMFQGISPKFQDNRFESVFLGSEILEWFSYQCIGDEVKIMELFSHLCNEWIGIAFSVVFCSHPRHRIYNDSQPLCNLTVNGKTISFSPGFNKIFVLSYYICTGRGTENHCGNVMQTDSVRLELKLIT